MKIRYFLGLTVSTWAMAFPCHAAAGTIFFELSLSENLLSIQNLGDSSAYFPQGFRLLANGRWEPLVLENGDSTMAECPPQSSINLKFPPADETSFPGANPILVRFFDQTGSGLGHVSFLDPPPTDHILSTVAYDHGQLTLKPPDPKHKIRSSWLLWPQMDGIKPLRAPVRFIHAQPDARRITWRDGPQFFAMAGQPEAMLLHETPEGLVLQNIPGSGLQGKEQRSPWLDAGKVFYGLAAAGGFAATAILLFPTKVRRGTAQDHVPS